MGKCRKFVLTSDFSCIVRKGRKYLFLTIFDITIPMDGTIARN